MVKKTTKITANNLSQKLDKFIVEMINFKINTNQKFESIENSIKHLPTTEQYFDREDKTMGMLKSIQEQLETTNHLYESTNKRVDIIDKKLNIDTSVVF